eukprot:m.99231 g.99231  ORF g.99231 m.99231 type:complete len:78 (+) comp15095_c0_seq1:104-337(+)
MKNTFGSSTIRTSQPPTTCRCFRQSRIFEACCNIISVGHLIQQLIRTLHSPFHCWHAAKTQNHVQAPSSRHHQPRHR